ncbi:aldo/keto reductase [Novosphingobium pokkalii]|uniref:Aldo/keto reductase n=2 Tax=Novosphingobium pokkalii TaxID=1770194 RepID=A0ABV7V7B1_9SPHN|nr:aldo/keto reductase [Novosphingobium pokkalii]
MAKLLGNTGLAIGPLVVGGNVFGWTIDEKRSFEVLDAFVAGGATMIDTADVYYAYAPGNVGGESETIIGRWMKARGNRHKVQVATKVGLLKINGETGLKPALIETAVEASLRRLDTDYIDVYFAHSDDEDVPQEAVARTFDRLVRSGKVRLLGASNFRQDRLQAALDIAEASGLAGYSVYQPQLNLMAAGAFPPGLRDVCVGRGMGVITFFALASGFLTGKYRQLEDVQGSHRHAALGRYFNPRGEAVLAALDSVAAQTGTTPAQIALAWIMATPGVTAPIVSATSVAQVESLLPAVTLRLDPAQMRILDAAAKTPV